MARRERRVRALVVVRALVAVLAMAVVLVPAAGGGGPAGAAPPIGTTLTVEPLTDTNVVGSQHCVTAKLKVGVANIQNARILFAVTGANPASGSRVTNNGGTAVFCYTGTRAGGDVITAVWDQDNDGADIDEATAVATKTWIAGVPRQVTVTPAVAENAVGDEHCVSARLLDEFGNPTPGVQVRFTVAGANPQPTAFRTTDANGVATYCYTGTNAGVDTITAHVDSNGDALIGATEPFGTATKTYIPRSPATVTLDPVADTNPAGTQHCVTATVSDVQGNPVAAGYDVRFQVSGANTAAGISATTAGGLATFCYTGTNAGPDGITAVVDADDDGDFELTEPAAAAAKLYESGPPAAVTVTPAVDENPVGERHCVTATVTDAFGNPVAGVRVVFDVSGANDQAPSAATTDATGQATYCYTGTVAGADTITVTADGDRDGIVEPGEPAGAAAKLYQPGAAATVEVAPVSDDNRVGEQHCVVATVRDAFGNTVDAGVVVRFTVTGANARTAQRTTDASGRATFCYTGTASGPDTITATADADRDGTAEAGEPAGAATKVYHPGQPATVQVSPVADTNRAGEQHCVTATVKDEFGNPVGAGITVVFSVGGANPTGGTRATNANGQATFCYTGTVTGVDIITATADGDEDGTAEAGEPSAAATKVYEAAPPATVEVNPPTANNRAGEQHCVTATVKDAFGNLVGPGVAVAFDVSGANDATGVRSTDDNGQAAFCYSGTVAGVDTITATADGDEDGTAEAGEPTGAATKVYRPGRPATVEVNPPSATNRAGEQHCVTATVRDEFGNPVEAGVAVAFDVSGANTAGGQVATDASGRATFCYTGTSVGVDTITATADGDEDGTVETGEPTGAATKVYRPGRPATVEVNPPTATNRAGEQHCVGATVRDEFGNPAEAGVVVAFEVTGANPTEAQRTTDAAGRATFCYTGTVAGADTITATADGDEDGTAEAGEPTGVATKVYRPGQAATVALTPETAVNPVDTQHCVTATVRDEFGNPVERGTVVEFTVTGSVSRMESRATGNDGTAEFCYQGPELPGADVITATADSDEDGDAEPGEPFDTAEKIWVLPATTPLCDSSIHDGGWIVAANSDRASFGGNAKSTQDSEVSGEQRYVDHGPVQPLGMKSIEILSIVCSTNPEVNRATVFGEGRVQGSNESTTFRLDLTDAGEPGRSDTYRILMANGYESGEQPLRGGNIQIRQEVGVS